MVRNYYLLYVSGSKHTISHLIHYLCKRNILAFRCMKYIRMGKLHPKSQCLNQFTGISDTIAYSYLPRTFELPNKLSLHNFPLISLATMYFIASSSLIMFFLVHSAELIVLTTLIIACTCV